MAGFIGSRRPPPIARPPAGNGMIVADLRASFVGVVFDIVRLQNLCFANLRFQRVRLI
jgi:hypothetical protein